MSTGSFCITILLAVLRTKKIIGVEIIVQL